MSKEPLIPENQKKANDLDAAQDATGQPKPGTYDVHRISPYDVQKITRNVFPEDILSNNYPYTFFAIRQYNETNILVDVLDSSSRIANSITEGIAEFNGKPTDNANEGDKQSPDSRATQTIILPLPQTLSNVYAPGWTIADKPFLTDVTNAQTKSGSDLSKIGSGAYTFLKSVVVGPLSQSAGVAIANPKKQALFTGITPRHFTLDYNLIAQNLGEAQTILKIYETFVKYALPKINNETANYFLFPYEFEIWFSGVTGSPHYKACVCEGVTINYGHDAIRLLESGHPTEIGLSLEFTEVDLKTYDYPGFDSDKLPPQGKR